MIKRTIRHRLLWVGIALGCAFGANAQVEFGKTDPDVEFPRLDVTTISLKADVKAGQRSYAVLSKDDTLTALPDTERVWLNDTLLDRTKDYTIRADDGFAVELAASRTPKKKDTVRISVDARRQNLTTGKLFTMSDLRGHVVVVDLWATWCGPCVHEIPDFIEYQKANVERKFSYVGVSVDNPGDLKDVRDFISKKKINYPMVLADRAFIESLMPVLGKRLEGIPTKIVLNRQGKVAFWVVGSPKGSPEETEFRDRLAALLAEPVSEQNKPVSVR